MTFKTQWTVEPKVIDSNNVTLSDEKYNISYDTANSKITTILLTTAAVNTAISSLVVYKAVEIKSDNPITLGIYHATTASVAVEFTNMTNMIFKGTVDTVSTTSAWFIRNEGTNDANVMIRILTS